MYRSGTNRRRDKKYFRRTASRTRTINIVRKAMRGGIRF